MTTTLNFKDQLDKPEWRGIAQSYSAATAGRSISSDLRKGDRHDPFIYQLSATTTIDCYSPHNDEWMQLAAFTAVGGTLAAGAFMKFCASHGPNGTISGTPTASAIALSALPNSASVAANALANCGDKSGYQIRVIGNTSGSSGKTEVRTIVANSAGATPTVYLDSPLSFTPAVGDRYEILSGRLYILGSGTTAAGFFKAYDIATNTISGNLSVTNLAATIGTETNGEMLDEQYVPNDRVEGEGFLSNGATYSGSLRCMVATAATSTSVTFDTSTLTDVAADEFKNMYQLRVVEDTTNKTAVGQRRAISTHQAAGAASVWTIKTAWTVTPSATAKYVVELNNDLVLWTGGAVVTYSYAAGGFAPDAAWSTAAVAGGASMQYANPPVAPGAGNVSAACWGTIPDVAHNAKQGRIVWFRGAATNAVYELDVTSGANGTWSAALPVNLQTQTFTTGTCGVIDPATSEGRYLYINVNGTQRMLRFDLKNRTFEPWTFFPMTQGTAVVGQRMAMSFFKDGTTYVSLLHHMVGTTTTNNWFDILLQR